MIVSLPMYDRAETAAANDRLWKATRARLGLGPETLFRGGDLWDQWLSPDLLLSQTCGYPYRARLHAKVQLVGTPDYGLAGCPPGNYRSVFITRADDSRSTPKDFATARFAYNEPLSQSGWAAPQNHAQEHGFLFTNTIQTGGHALSAQAVADGKADIAALDALSWHFIRKYDDFANGLKEIAATPPTPVLPFITALGHDRDAIASALQTAIADLSQADRTLLHLKGLVVIPAQEYLEVPNPPPPA